MSFFNGLKDFFMPNEDELHTAGEPSTSSQRTAEK